MKRISLFFLSFLLNQWLSGQCNGNNTFLGTTNDSWHLATNWSSNCVPSLPLTDSIVIAANCTLQDTMDYHLGPNNKLIINEGITLSILVGIPNTSNWTCGDTIQYGGQIYGTLLIGNQCWMTENLNIGTMIPAVNNQANNNIIEKYCADDSPAECATYGGLYQWNELMHYLTQEGAKGICPSGWHIPTENDWLALDTTLPGIDKGSQIAGDANLWDDGALEQSSVFEAASFNVLPGGLSEEGSTFSQNFNAFFWTSTPYGVNAAGVNIYYDITDILPTTSPKGNGYSVRCLKD